MGLCCSCNQTSSDKCKSPCSPLSLTPIPITKAEKAQSVLAIRDRAKNNAHVEVSLVGNLVTSGVADNQAMSKFSTIVKGKVSKKRIRYQQNGYDLDLTYITSSIIAMGYPASNIEAVYRNNIEDVARFLDGAHKDHYKIYNLCSERSYDTSKFHNRVEVFPFDDHNPPNLELIRPFCNSVDDWLKEDTRNVAVVHCKAGKGRTGTMICCYLLHSGKFLNSEEALNFYGSKRTQDMKGVTIPSQLRYVNYYARFVRDSIKYRPVQVYIKEVILEPSPCFSGGNMGTLCFSISQPITAEGPNGQPYQKLKKVLKSEEYDVKKSVPKFCVQLDSCSPLTGDVKVEFYYKMLRKEKVFQFWFNTFFVCDRVHVYDPVSNGCLNKNGSTTDDLLQQTFKLTLCKKELDIVNKKDKQNKTFSSDFHISLLLSRVPLRHPPTNHIQSNTSPTSNLPNLQPYPSNLTPQHSHTIHNLQSNHGNGSAIQSQQQQQHPPQWREYLRKQQQQQQQRVNSNNNSREQQQQQRSLIASTQQRLTTTGTAGQSALIATPQAPGFGGSGHLNPQSSSASSAAPYHNPNKLPPPPQQPHTSQQQQLSSPSNNIVICSDSSTSSSDDDSSDGFCGGGAAASGDKDDDDTNDDEYNWDSGESTYL